jgi:hypothetical protein
LNSLPWYLNLNINNVRNLFSQIELPYEIDCYICVCGHNEIIIKGQNSILEKYTFFIGGHVEEALHTITTKL